MKLKYIHIYSVAVLLILFLGNCKKDKITSEDDSETTTETTASASGTRTELTMDSLFLYAKEIYLWNDALPTYSVFNPRGYTSYGTDITALEKELFNITQYKVNSTTGLPYEYYADYPTYPKYSYIEENSSSGTTSTIRNTNTTSYVDLDGVGTDFGIGLSAVSASDIRIRYVNPSSPADKASLVRGDRVLSVNSHTASAGSQTEVDYINNAFSSSSITLSIKKASGTTVSVTLNQTTYTTSPVLKTSVITSGNKTIGYLAFARFSSPTNAQSDLDNAFSAFAKAGVTDLVIDLRYNGGGYVSTAEHLVNLIAPSSLNNKVMYTEYYNSMMQNGTATILKNQPYYEDGKLVSYTGGVNGKYVTYADFDFSTSGNVYKFSKLGSVDNIINVCFIVSGNTASASELTINSLKPYLNVKLVGTTTYGKPVGFFGINIDKYTVYMSNFQSKNANGEGDYFNGMSVDIAAADDPTKDFGDVSENCLAKAISYLTTGSTTSNKTSASVLAESPTVIETSNSFTGMIEERHKLK